MNPRWLVVLGVTAVVSVFVLPPVGLVLGVLTLVYAIRAMRATRPEPQQLLTPEGLPVTVSVARPGRSNAVFSLVLGITATVLGALVMIALLTFWTEISDYVECEQGTNTTQGEQKCRDALEQAIKDRLGQ